MTDPRLDVCLTYYIAVEAGLLGRANAYSSCKWPRLLLAMIVVKTWIFQPHRAVIKACVVSAVEIVVPRYISSLARYICSRFMVVPAKSVSFTYAPRNHPCLQDITQQVMCCTPNNKPLGSFPKRAPLSFNRWWCHATWRRNVGFCPKTGIRF